MMIDDQHRNPNTNNKDHLVGQLTKREAAPTIIIIIILVLDIVRDQLSKISALWQNCSGLLDGSRLSGEGEGVLADQEARALPQVQPEEAGREWAGGEWWGVSSSDLGQNWSRSDAAWVEEEGVEVISCLEVIEIWQQISNLSYFKMTRDIDWQNIPRSQLFW